MAVQRGDVYLADLDPVRGSEANKVRPVVVVSNDAFNEVADERRRGVVAVVPMTSNTRRVLAFQTSVPRGEAGLRMDSKTQPEQIRGLAVERFGPRTGRLSRASMADLDRALRLHLAL